MRAGGRSSGAHKPSLDLPREIVPTGKGEDPLADPSGVMPDGRAFENADEFKQLLIKDRKTFQHAFIEHLCTYALRRVLTVDDEEDIQLIVEQVKKTPGGVRDIVRAVATSELMKKR